MSLFYLHPFSYPTVLGTESPHKSIQCKKKTNTVSTARKIRFDYIHNQALRTSMGRSEGFSA